jgi:hypothetical protein
VYKPDEIEQICKQIFEDLQSGLSLRKSLDADGMPDRVTFYRWMEGNEELCNQYARACEARAEHIADEIIEIADNKEDDTIAISKGGQLIEIENREWTSRSKLKIEARQWLLGKMMPKKYGTTHQEVKVTQEQPLFPDVSTDNSDK